MSLTAVDKVLFTRRSFLANYSNEPNLTVVGEVIFDLLAAKYPYKAPYVLIFKDEHVDISHQAYKGIRYHIRKNETPKDYFITTGPFGIQKLSYMVVLANRSAIWNGETSLGDYFLGHHLEKHNCYQCNHWYQPSVKAMLEDRLQSVEKFFHEAFNTNICFALGMTETPWQERSFSIMRGIVMSFQAVASLLSTRRSFLN